MPHTRVFLPQEGGSLFGFSARLLQLQSYPASLGKIEVQGFRLIESHSFGPVGPESSFLQGFVLDPYSEPLGLLGTPRDC